MSDCCNVKIIEVPGGGSGGGPYNVIHNNPGPGQITVIDTGSGESFTFNVNDALDLCSLTPAQITCLTQAVDFTQLTTTQVTNLTQVLDFTQLTTTQIMELSQILDLCNLTATQITCLTQAIDFTQLTATQITELMSILDFTQLTAAQCEDIATCIANNPAAITTIQNALSFVDITGIDLQATGNPNEYTVAVSWTDSNGNPQTTTDPTPITVTGGADTSGSVETAAAALTTTNGVAVPVGGTYIEFPDGTTWASTAAAPTDCVVTVDPAQNVIGAVPAEDGWTSDEFSFYVPAGGAMPYSLFGTVPGGGSFISLQVGTAPGLADIEDSSGAFVTGVNISSAANTANNTVTVPAAGTYYYRLVRTGANGAASNVQVNLGPLDFTLSTCDILSNSDLLASQLTPALISGETGNTLRVGDDGRIYADPNAGEQCYIETGAPVPAVASSFYDNRAATTGETSTGSNPSHIAAAQEEFIVDLSDFVAPLVADEANNDWYLRTVIWDRGGAPFNASNNFQIAAFRDGVNVAQTTGGTLNGTGPSTMTFPVGYKWQDGDIFRFVGAANFQGTIPYYNDIDGRWTMVGDDPTLNAGIGGAPGDFPAGSALSMSFAFEQVPLTEHRVTTYDDGEGPKLIEFDANGDPQELASIPASWTACGGLTSAGLTETDIQNAQVDYVKTGDACYQEPSWAQVSDASGASGGDSSIPQALGQNNGGRWTVPAGAAAGRISAFSNHVFNGVDGVIGWQVTNVTTGQTERYETAYIQANGQSSINDPVFPPIDGITAYPTGAEVSYSPGDVVELIVTDDTTGAAWRRSQPLGTDDAADWTWAETGQINRPSFLLYQNDPIVHTVCTYTDRTGKLDDFLAEPAVTGLAPITIPAEWTLSDECFTDGEISRIEQLISNAEINGAPLDCADVLACITSATPAELTTILNLFDMSTLTAAQCVDVFQCILDNGTPAQWTELLGNLNFQDLTATQCADIGECVMANLTPTAITNLTQAIDFTQLTGPQVTNLMSILDFTQLTVAQVNDLVAALPPITVNAGTTASITDDANGTGSVQLGDTIHLWSSDGTILVAVAAGSAIADLRLNPTVLTGIAHTAITGIDLQATANANEYTVAISWTDENGDPQTTTDPTPIVIGIDTFGSVETAGAALTTTNGVALPAGGDYVEFPNGDTYAAPGWTFEQFVANYSAAGGGDTFFRFQSAATAPAALNLDPLDGEAVNAQRIVIANNNATHDLTINNTAGFIDAAQSINSTTASLTLEPGQVYTLTRTGSTGRWTVSAIYPMVTPPRQDTETFDLSTQNFTAALPTNDNTRIWHWTASVNGTVTVPVGNDPSDRRNYVINGSPAGADLAVDATALADYDGPATIPPGCMLTVVYTEIGDEAHGFLSCGDAGQALNDAVLADFTANPTTVDLDNDDTVISPTALRNVLRVHRGGNTEVGTGAGAGSTEGGSIYVGSNSGSGTVADQSIAMGANAAQNAQGTRIFAIGGNAARFSHMNASVAIGQRAGFEVNAGPDGAGGTLPSIRNVFVGDDAGRNAIGTENHAIGYRSMGDANATNSIAIGTDAGRLMSATSSIGIGATALTGAVDAVNVVAIGTGAAQALPTAQGSVVAVGAGAANAMVSGTNVVAIGANAFAGADVAGFDSVAVGSGAGQNATNGSGSTYVGGNSGVNATGQLNTFYGSSAGANSTAVQSIAIGRNAGLGASGQGHYIGQNAGSGASGVDVTAIGRSAGANNTGSRVLALGTSAGAGNTIAQAVILGHFELPRFASQAAAAAVLPAPPAALDPNPGSIYVFWDTSDNCIKVRA